MKTYSLLLMLLAFLISSCGMIAPAPAPTPIPLPPPQYAESAFQWLETHAMMKGNLDWAALRNDTAESIASAKTTADTLPAICGAIRGLKDGNAWILVPGLKTPNFYTGYYTLYPENQVVILIAPNSPAEKAGLQVGDRITQVNGHSPIPYDEMDADPPCNEKPIDTSLNEHLVIDRKGQSVEIDVKKTQLIAGNDYFHSAPRSQRLGSDPGGIGYIELTLENGWPYRISGRCSKTHANYGQVARVRLDDRLAA